MKIIKKILIAILSIILVDLISILVFSFNLKKIIVNGVIKEIITVEMTKQNNNEGNFIITKETINQITDDEQIREILNSQEVENLINKYLDLTIDSMIDEKNLDNIELEKDMLNFLEDNKEKLEKVAGKEITEEALIETKKQLEDKDWSRSYKQTIQNTSRNLTKNEKIVLKGYNFLISAKFKIIISFLILVNLLLIAIIQKSLYKWIKILAKASIIASIMITIISIVTKIIVIKSTSLKSFNINSLLVSAMTLIISGIILLILYKIIFKKKEDQYDLSKTST